MSLEDKAKDRRLRIRSKVKSGGRVSREIKERPKDKGEPRRNILYEIAQRSQRD